MFDDKLFEYLIATDQIDDVLGTTKKENNDIKDFSKKSVLKRNIKLNNCKLKNADKKHFDEDDCHHEDN